MSPWLQSLKLRHRLERTGSCCYGVEVAVLHRMHDILGALTGNSLPSVVEISSGTESQKNTEKMARSWMAGEPGQDPAFAVCLLVVLGESLYPLQFLLL